jgi:hypothetical protein
MYPDVEEKKYLCTANRSDKCTEYYYQSRRLKGYNWCLACGDVIAKERKFTVACNNKQGYELIYDPRDLCTTNPKRTM